MGYVVFGVKGAGGRKPLARVGDKHTCPKKNEHGPHQGGPVLTGDASVLINGKPAARVQDKLHCNFTSDQVAKGIPSLTFNGKPAARLGDKCEHGGVIEKGSPNVFVEEFQPVKQEWPTLPSWFDQCGNEGDSWLQAQVIGAPCSLNWTLETEHDTFEGATDELGQTDKVTGLAEGTATLHFQCPGASEAHVNQALQPIMLALSHLADCIVPAGYEGPQPNSGDTSVHLTAAQTERFAAIPDHPEMARLLQQFAEKAQDQAYSWQTREIFAPLSDLLASPRGIFAVLSGGPGVLGLSAEQKAVDLYKRLYETHLPKLATLLDKQRFCFTLPEVEVGKFHRIQVFKDKVDPQPLPEPPAFHAPQPVVDAVYATGEKRFYFLTQADQAAIKKAQAPFAKAAKQVYQAEQAAAQAKRDEQGKLPQAIQTQLFQARQAMNKVLEGYVGTDKLAEIFVFNDAIAEPGWCYLPQSVLDKVALFTQIKRDAYGHVTYTPYSRYHITVFKPGDNSEDPNEKGGDNDEVLTSDKIRFSTAKEALIKAHEGSDNLFQFNTAHYEGHLLRIGAQLEQNLSFHKDIKTSWMDLKADGGARILRYTAQASASGNYNSKTGKLTLNGEGQASVDFLSAHIDFHATLPSDPKGYHLQIPPAILGEPIDLGCYQLQGHLALYETAGASIMACGSVTVSPNGNVMPLALPAQANVSKPPSDNLSKLTSGNLLKGHLELPNTFDKAHPTQDKDDKEKQEAHNGADLQAGAFVGVAAGCAMAGKLNWLSPESVRPIQNPNKNSEALGHLQGEGQPQWAELADLSIAVEGDAGIGLSLGIGIGYHDRRFVLSCHARLVFGDGAGGKIQFGLNQETLERLVIFIAHQLKNINFNQAIMNKLFSGNVLETLSFLLVGTLWQDIEIGEYAYQGVEKLKQWFKYEISQLLHHESICDRLVKLAHSVLQNKKRIEHLTPAAKGYLLYHLSQYFTWIESRDPAPAKAMIKILSHIQSSQEWLEILQNVVSLEKIALGGGDSITAYRVSPIRGQATLLHHLSDAQTQTVIDLESQLEQQSEQLLKADQALYHHCIYHACKRADQQGCDNGSAKVLLCMHYMEQSLRGKALTHQGMTELKVNIDKLNQLIRAANDYNMQHHSPPAYILREENKITQEKGEAMMHSQGVSMASLPI